MNLKKGCIFSGTIFKLHGYKGEVNIYTEDVSINLKEIKYFLININEVLVPFFTDSVRQKKENILLVKFTDINSESKAKEILRKKTYLPKDIITQNKIKKEEKELLGYKVKDINHGSLGEITEINTQTSQPLIYVEGKSIKFCFPMHKEFIKEINQEKNTITTNIPKELINLN